MIKIFEAEDTLEDVETTEKKQAANRTMLMEVALLLTTFVLVPIISIVIVTSGEQRAIYNSISRLAWPEGKLALVFLWGIINMGNYAFALKLALDAGGYTKKWKRMFAVMTALCALFISVGICFPAYPEQEPKLIMLRTVHSALCIIGLAGFFITIIVLTATLYKRNKRQFALSLSMLLFIFIGGIFSILEVNDSTSYCLTSSVAQIFMFGMFNAMLTIEYFLMTVFPNEALEESDKE